MPFDKNPQLLALIMGGGIGKRLFPLTMERCKPAIGFAGMYRLIDIPISNCIHSGIDKIFVLTQFLSVSLHRHIYQTYRFDIFSNGLLQVLSAEQTQTSLEWYQGTADAVRRSIRHFERFAEENILILSGDQLYKMDFKDILNFHLAKKADITVACVPIPDEEISRMGILKMDSACRINRFLEKPKGKKNKAELYSLLPKEIQAKTGKSKAYLASMGIYLFKKEVLIEVLNASQKEDFGRQIIPEAVSKYKVYGYTFADYWEDIGTIASYFRASLELTKENPRFKLVDEKWPLFTHPRFLPGAIIRDSKVHQAIICNGCQIEKAEIDNSIIGIRTRIRPGAKIKEAILMGNDFYSFSDGKKDYRPLIGKNVTIQRAIIDKNVTIGDNCRIIGKEGVADRDEKLYCLRDGIVIIPRGRTIPSGFSV